MSFASQDDMKMQRIIRRAVIFIAIVIGIMAMQRFQSFLIPTTIGAFLALILTPVVARLEARGVPRALAAGGIVLGALIFLGGAVYSALPSYDDYVSRLPEIARDIERKLAPLQERAEDAGLLEAASPDTEKEDGEAGGEELVLPTPAPSFYTDMALEAPAFLGNFLYIVFLAFFAIYDRKRIVRLALATQSSYADRAWVFRVMQRFRGNVARYLLTVTVINIGLGIAVGLSFWALGMPNPLLWGTAMALLNFIPYLGAGIMNVAAFAVAFVHFPSFALAMLPVIVLLTLNLIEGQMVTPMVLGSKVVNGALPVFLAVTFGAWLWGPAGAVLATPALIVAQTVGRTRKEERR